MEIVAALIGAVAVVAGVFLAQRLTDHRREVEKRGEVGRTLKNEVSELTKFLSDPQVSAFERTHQIVRVSDLVSELQGACAHMSRNRRAAINSIFDEYRAILLNLPGWVERKGLLSDDDGRAVIMWTGYVIESIGEGPGIDPDVFMEQLSFYAENGPAGIRPGGPGFKVPPRGRWHQFKSMMVGEG